METSDQQPSTHSEKTAPKYWLKDGRPTGLFDKTGQWIRVLSAAGPYTVYEVNGDLLKIDPENDHWVKNGTLSEDKPENALVLKPSLPSTGNNQVNLDEAIRKRELENASKKNKK